MIFFKNYNIHKKIIINIHPKRYKNNFSNREIDFDVIINRCPTCITFIIINSI